MLTPHTHAKPLVHTDVLELSAETAQIETMDSAIKMAAILIHSELDFMISMDQALNTKLTQLNHSQLLPNSLLMMALTMVI